MNGRDSGDLIETEVTVIGGGLAGMAASIHLARAGFRVVCVEPNSGAKQPVGESLDWSAPDLLSALGLPMDRLIRERFATYKRYVTLNLADGSKQHYVPGEWLGQPPFNLELRTMHLDRLRFDEELRSIFTGHGVTLLQDRVVGIEKAGRRVGAVSTAQGKRLVSPWFIDASGGGASLFPRSFNLPVYEYGPRKVAIWGYFNVPEAVEGTSLYAYGTKPRYMEWIWEIPIRENEISVGYVAAGESIKAQRQYLTVEEIFRAQLSHFPRLKALLNDSTSVSPSVTAFQCRVHGGVSGPNWLVIGESASMVDPMTANGVTAALRHAVEATAIITKSRCSKELPTLSSAMYNRRVLDVGRFFNCGIEKVIYDRHIRNRVGVLTAGRVYTIPAFSLNSLYSRIRPNGVLSTILFGFVLSLFRCLAAVYRAVCGRFEATGEAAN
jgi:flavin-dependent dehydrogenase